MVQYLHFRVLKFPLIYHKYVSLIRLSNLPHDRLDIK
jgi:hypothetical protein